MVTRAAVLLVLAASGAAAQGTSLQVVLPGRVVTVTASQLRALPTDTVRYTPHDSPPRIYRAATLGDVLAAAGMPFDSLRVGRAAWTIIAEARDGYIAAFTAAEADPHLGPSRVWVAFEVDGHALGSDEAPYRLIVPTDARGARSAHQVTTLRVVDAARP